MRVDEVDSGEAEVPFSRQSLQQAGYRLVMRVKLHLTGKVKEVIDLILADGRRRRSCRCRCRRSCRRRRSSSSSHLGLEPIQIPLEIFHAKDEGAVGAQRHRRHHLLQLDQLGEVGWRAGGERTSVVDIIISSLIPSKELCYRNISLSLCQSQPHWQLWQPFATLTIAIVTIKLSLSII